MTKTIWNICPANSRRNTKYGPGNQHTKNKLPPNRIGFGDHSTRQRWYCNKHGIPMLKICFRYKRKRWWKNENKITTIYKQNFLSEWNTSGSESLEKISIYKTLLNVRMKAYGKNEQVLYHLKLKENRCNVMDA